MEYRTYSEDANLIKRYEELFEDCRKNLGTKSLALALVQIKAFGLRNKIFGKIAKDFVTLVRGNDRLKFSYDTLREFHDIKPAALIEDLRESLHERKCRELMATITLMYADEFPPLKSKLDRLLVSREKRTLKFW